MHYISQAHAYLINPSKIHHKVQHPYCGDEDCRCGPLDSGEGPNYGEGLTRSAAGDTLAGLSEPADGGCTKEKILHVRLKIKNFGSTSPARGGFQPTRNNGTKADNHNGMKADNPNGTKAKNHNGTKADNPNDTNALNFHTHRSEVSNRS